MLAIDMREPIPDILQVLDVLQQHGNESLARWFRNGLQTYLDNGDKTLDACLGMRGQSERSWRYKFLMMQRNNHLRTAHSFCSGETTWGKSCQLEKELLRFESIIWPRLRHLDDVPEGMSGLRTSLFRAFKLNLPIPTSARRLHDIVVLGL